MAIAILIYQFVDNLAYFRQIFNSIINLLMPFIYGFAFAYIFNPILNWLERIALPFITRHKLSVRTYRYLGVLFTLVFAISLIVIFFSFIIPELGSSVSSIVTHITSYATNFKTQITNLISGFSKSDTYLPIINRLMDSMEQLLQKALTTLSQSLTDIINTTIITTINITSMLVKIIIGIIIAVYLWLSKETFFAQMKKLCFAFFPRKFVEGAIWLTHESDAIFSGFISGKILDSIIIGILCFLGMHLLGIPYALLISVIVGVTNVIPYFGPFIGAIPSGIFLLMVDPAKALWFGVFILVLQQIDGNIIGPKILGDSTGLPAFWVIFSVTIFGGLFGFVGMLVGVPLFALIYMIVKNLCELKLKKKNLPIGTGAFASKKNPLLDDKQKDSKSK